MESAPTLLPIPGDLVDPPAQDLPKGVRQLQSRRGPVGTSFSIGLRTSTRFTQSRATLLAAGTTYYLFLALFSALTLAYGLTAALGAFSGRVSVQADHDPFSQLCGTARGQASQFGGDLGIEDDQVVPTQC